MQILKISSTFPLTKPNPIIPMKKILIILLVLPLFLPCLGQKESAPNPAPAPLYRDPITDGAADPVVIWNREEQSWWMLDTPTNRPDDHPSGAHGDVLVVGDKAYVFYFTHPGRQAHIDSPNGPDDILPFALRRSSIQVGELVFKDGTLICNRENFDFLLPNQ